MRIQHNIPAMSAYRNYTNNTSALSKNLEKLSSGYKINRAGDDAAGLAISEKMRAQITGLEVAQKNAKDGISLIQTAEGALTEVHSMLNRMYELAEQSANGTYQDDVDREQLQKEVNQLRTEINRISKASNFNGIKLLDGSLNAGDITTTTAGTSGVEVKILDDIGADDDPFVEVGKKTILKEEGTTALESKFTANLENMLIVNAQVGDSLTMNIGDGVELTLNVVETATKANEITADQAKDSGALAKAFGDLFKAAKADGGADGKINGQAINIKGADGTKSYITFEQAKAPTNKNEVIDANLPVTLTFTKADAAGGAGKTREAAPVDDAGGGTGGTTTYATTVENTQNTTTGTEYNEKIGIKGITVDAKQKFGEATATKTNVTVTIPAVANNKLSATISGITDGPAIKQMELVYGNDDKSKTGDATGVDLKGISSSDLNAAAKLTITLDDDTKVEIEFDQLGKWEGKTQNTITFEATTTATTTPAPGPDDPGPTPGPGGDDNPDPDAKPVDSETAGTYVVDTTVNQQGAMESKGQLASTKITMADQFAKDGGTLTIGKTTYVFKVGKDSVVTDDSVKGIKLGEGESVKVIEVTDAKLAYFPNSKNAVFDVIGQEISQDKENAAFDLGYNKDTQTLSIHEKVDQNAYTDELKTHDEFQKLITSGTVASTTTKNAGGKQLVLQIGDTAEEFNKLGVNIKACDAAGMGIADIDISSQEGASTAMEAIKNAINYVSDVRGSLGATQNRLDHTINNISVMQENIQDAESTIRDVDVAKEMMEYTKNNILVQSAQAMLAQANQLPQGVLQLLQ